MITEPSRCRDFAGTVPTRSDGKQRSGSSPIRFWHCLQGWQRQSGPQFRPYRDVPSLKVPQPLESVLVKADQVLKRGKKPFPVAARYHNLDPSFLTLTQAVVSPFLRTACLEHS